MTTAFPNTPDFTGHNAPSRIECDLFDLVVEGTIPEEIQGSWFRSVPDPQYPPMLRSANVVGEVLAQFVVDTAGRVDMSTFHILKSTHDLFTQAVKATCWAASTTRP